MISFDKLLLKTAFCCMASDGHIDPREVQQIEKLCKNSPLFQEFDFQHEINILVGKINSRGKEFIRYYFGLLDQAELSEEEELMMIDFAIQTIQADEQIEYSEIKFFKNIRHRLSVSNEKILSVYPDIETFLEDDITVDSFLDKITRQYMEGAEFPQFKEVSIDLDE